jgi:hypothetical protein
MLRSELSANSRNVAPCGRRVVASFCCAGAVREGVRLMCFPWALARPLPSAWKNRALQLWRSSKGKLRIYSKTITLPVF